MRFSKVLSSPIVFAIYIAGSVGVGFAQGNPWSADPCGRGSSAHPVLVYDAETRNAQIMYQAAFEAFLPDAHGYFALPVIDPPPARFLCDGRPAHIWIVNRRFKEIFSVTTTSVFTLSNGLPEIRGISNAPSVTQPAAPSSPTAPAAKGGLAGPTKLTTDVVVGDLLNEELFDQPLQKLRIDESTVAELSRFVNGQFADYTATLNNLIGPQLMPAPPPQPGAPLMPPPVQGNATLGGTAQNFVNETALINGRFPAAGLARPALVTAETDFDQLTSQISQIVADIPRINAKIQAYPVVDVLVNLRSQVDAYEDSVRVLDNEYHNVRTAIAILTALDIIAGNIPYLEARNAGELQTLLTQRYGGTTAANMDAATIARIVNLYIANHRYIGGMGDLLRARLAILTNELSRFNATSRLALGLPCDQDAGGNCGPGQDGFSAPDAFQQALGISTTNLGNLRIAIGVLNAAEANTFAAINQVYDTYRAQPIPLNVDLQGNSGNLIVFYSIASTQQFQRFAVTSETLQPESACVQSLAAGNGTNTGTPNCLTAASAPTVQPPVASASGTNASASSPAGSATTSASATPPSPDFYGRFEVHHFVRGALITGLAYDSIGNRSYSWVACPSATSAPGACTTSKSAGGTTYQLLQTNSPQAAVVVGVNIFIRREDMFPSVGNAWWQRYLPTEPFIGASVYPLNHYFVGGSMEPIHGFNFTVGPDFGSQTSLPHNWPYAPGDQLTVATGGTAPTVPSSSRFRAGVFAMVGFDTSIFKAIFGSIWGNVTSVTSVGSPPAASSSSSSTSSSSQ